MTQALRSGLAGLALCLSAAAWAEAPADDSAERERIRAERAAVEATYLQQLEVCSKRFVVTSCVDAARGQRHAAVTELDRQQRLLDEARRTQRAAERQQAIDSKVGGEEARLREEAARDRSATRRASGEPGTAPTPASAAPRAARPASTPAERAAQEERARQAFDLKQQRAEAHRQEVARRNQERALKANPGAPLPTPSASAVAASAAGT
jgi:hypothetical protein